MLTVLTAYIGVIVAVPSCAGGAGLHPQPGRASGRCIRFYKFAKRQL